MCGIAGLIRFDNNKVTDQQIKTTILSLKHRGPDNSGFWLSEDRDKFLVNTRLSILDLSKKGNQPFYYQNKNYVIVFNGEIYNYKNLKKKLNEFEFKSNSDTEVLLYLYVKFGEHCLDMLDGMFSFAIFDKKNNKLFCARDRYGIKPYYYVYTKNFFFFSSEIISIKKMNLIKNQINFRSVSSYLTSEYYENISKTFYKNIIKLKPGHFLTLRENSLKEESFTNFEKDIKKITIPKKVNEKEKQLYFLLNQAVKKSLVSDVKYSLASSGGLDSSILQILTKVNTRSKLSLISFIFKEEKYSEEKYIKYFAKKMDLKVKSILITPETFLKLFSQVNKICEEPHAGLPVMAYYECIKKCNKNKIILDGSGIDECHLGYEKYLNDSRDLFSIGQDNSISVIDKNINKFFLKKYNNYNFLKKKYFKEDYKNKMFYDLFYIKIPRALRFRDKISMSNSVELRPSFLDRDLISYFFNLDLDSHYKNGLQKYLIRKTFKNKFSDNFFYLKKRQIQTPQREWLKNELNGFVKERINNSALWDFGFYNKNNFLKNYEFFLKDKINNSFFIWQFLNLDSWISENNF